MRDSGYHIRTGFVGAPPICDALCSTGHHAAAYRLLLQQRECPSWLYPVTMGATTIWERWDSMRPDGSINLTDMASFNHYVLGAVADWMHRTIGSLARQVPGYRRLAIRPHPGGGLTHCRTRHLTPYGQAECAWKIAAGNFDLDVVMTPNTTALVSLPGGPPGGDTAPVEVGSGSWHWSVPYSDPDARGPYTADDLVGDILSDSAARDAIMGALAPMEGSRFLTRTLSYERNLTLRRAVAPLPKADKLLVKLVAILDGLSRQ